MKEYTRAEVARHNRMGDIWFIIHKYVYDVTQFIYEHPGGQEAHLRVAGKDASECFDEVGHSDEAEMLMKKFRIGTVIEGGVRTPGHYMICGLRVSTHAYTLSATAGMFSKLEKTLVMASTLLCTRHCHYPLRPPIGLAGTIAEPIYT